MGKRQGGVERRGAPETTRADAEEEQARMEFILIIASISPYHRQRKVDLTLVGRFFAALVDAVRETMIPEGIRHWRFGCKDER